METPKVQVFSRLGSAAPPGSPQEPKVPSSISWRKVSLLATPIVLGLINLVDAYVDKKKDMFGGDQLYRTAVESGRGQAKEILKQANQSADVIYKERTAGAKTEAENILLGAAKKAAQTRKQGAFDSERERLMAEKTQETVDSFLSKRVQR